MTFYYNLDARAKLLFILLLTLPVFLIDKLPIAVCMLVTFFIIRLTAKIPLISFTLIKNLTLLVLFIILIQAVFGPGDTYIVKPLIFGVGSIKWEGLLLGLTIACRLAALVIILPIFTETTAHHQIASGLCALGLNYRTAFIITTAFNLIPAFKEEALVIMDAQKLRGMRNYGIKAYAGLLIPLMLGAMRKAQVSSAAMDSRAFGVYNTRTWIEKPQMKKNDYCFAAVSVVFSAGLIFLNYFF